MDYMVGLASGLYAIGKATRLLCYEHCRVYHPEVETNNVSKAVRAALAMAEGGAA